MSTIVSMSINLALSQEVKCPLLSFGRVVQSLIRSKEIILESIDDEIRQETFDRVQSEIHPVKSSIGVID